MSRPASSLSGQILKGGAWSIVAQALTLLASLVAAPFTIRLLGPEAYGVLALLNVLVGQVALLDLGMAGAATRFGARAYARGDASEEATTMWTALVISAACSLVAVTATAVFSDPLLARLFKLPPHLLAAARTALYLALLAYLVRTVSGVVNTPQLIRMRYGVNNAIGSGCAILQTGTVPVVLFFGGGLVGALLVGLVANLLALFLYAAVTFGLVPALRRPRFDRRLAVILVRYGGPTMLSGFAATFLTHGEKLLLGRYESVRALAYYAVAMTLVGILNTAGSLVTQPLFPAFSQLHGAEQRERVKRLYQRALRAILLGLLPLFVLAAVLAKPFLTVWAGPEYGAGSSIAVWILLPGILANILTRIPAHLLRAHARTDIVALIHLCELPFYIAVALVLVRQYGVAGAAMAWTARLLADSIIFFALTRRAFGYAGFEFLNGRASLLMALLMPPLLLQTVSSSTTLVLASTVLCIGVYVWAVLKMLLTEAERQIVRQLLVDAAGKLRGRS